MDKLNEAVTLLDEIAQRPDQKSRVQYVAKYLQSLSLESVRSEALRDAQKACLELEIFYDNAITDTGDFRLLEGKREGAKRCVEAIAALQSPARVAEGWVCPRCKGSGEAKGMTYGQGPDDHEIDIPCPDCNGTGELQKAVHSTELRK